MRTAAGPEEPARWSPRGGRMPGVRRPLVAAPLGKRGL